MATFTVTNNQDTQPSAAIGSLRDAIERANSNPGKDTIVFDPSLNGQTIELDTPLLGGPILQITDDLEIIGPGPQELTITGGLRWFTPGLGVNQGDPTGPGVTTLSTGGQIFVIDDGNASNDLDVTISGLSLTRGVDQSEFGVVSEGGAIRNLETLAVDQVAFIRNFGNAGGIYNEGSLSVTNSFFSGNGLDIGPTAIWSTSGDVVIDNTVFDTNLGGGVVRLESNSTFEVRNSQFRNNEANPIDVRGGTLNVSNSSFVRNSGDGIQRSGGVLATNTDVNIVNSTFLDNEVLQFFATTPFAGEALKMTGGNLRIANTVLSRFSPGSDPDKFNPDVMLSDTTNVLVNSNNWVGDGSLSGAQSGDPLLPFPFPSNSNQITLVNGVPHFRLDPLQGSPLIDSGDTSLAVDPATGQPLTTDEIQRNRVSGSSVDIGAFEFQERPFFLVGKTAAIADGENAVNEVGDVIDYTITVNNQGNVALTNVNVSDPLLTNLTGPQGDNNNNNQLDIGEIWTYTGSYTITQADLDNNGEGDGDIDNTVTVTTDEAGEQTDSVAVPLLQNLDVSFEKKVNGDEANSAPGLSVNVGDSITYTYEVTNNSNVDLPTVVLLDDNGTPDDLDDDFIWLAEGGSVSVAEDLTLTAGDNGDLLFSPGETWIFESTSQTAQLGQVTNQALFGAETPPFFDASTQVIFAENSATYTASPAPNPSIDLVKLVNGEDRNDPSDPLPVTEGDAITYTYEVTNSGNVDFRGVALRDDNGTPGDSSDTLTYFTEVDSSGTVTNTSQGISLTSGDDGDTILEVGETWILTIDTPQAAQQGVITNTVVANADSETLIFSLPDATDTDTASYEGSAAPNPSISFNKLINGVEGPLNLDVGDPVNYTYEVTNDGNVNIRQVRLRDNNATPLDNSDDLTWTNRNANGLTRIQDGDGDNLLEPGETWTFEADPQLAQDGTFTNRAVIRGRTPDGSILRERDTATYTGTDTVTPPNIITGTTGMDMLDGTASRDIITGLEGMDMMSGGTGDDDFVFNNINEGLDYISDFQSGADRLILTDLIDSLGSPADPIGDGFIQLLDLGATGTLVQVDPDGSTGSASTVNLVVLEDVNNVDPDNDFVF